MKKKLLFISLFAFGAVNAQFTDDIESYSLGPIHQGNWTSWSGNAGAEDGIVTDFRASSGTQSIFIDLGGNTSQDCILDLVTSTGGATNITSGQWTLEFKMYIPSDSAGYYNFQEVMPIGGGSFGFEFFLGDTSTSNAPIVNGLGVMKATGATPTTFSFPNDTWMTITHYIDLTNDSIRIMIDNNPIYWGPAYTNDVGGSTTFGHLAAVDFFPASNTNSYYIDDVNFSAGYAKVDNLELSSTLSVYPNPVTDVLYINAEKNINTITIYDMMGKVVKTLTTNTSNLTVNTDELPSGAYMIKVDMGETSKTVKVIK